jgi:PAP2 superfamily
MIVRCLVLLALLAPPASAQMLRHGGEAPPPPPATGTPVGRWSVAADRLGRGAANWRSMAVMHIAMHDALNAAEPRFARWAPAAPDEPPADGASPLVAMAAAAYQVLLARHQEDAAEEADPLFRAALAAEPAGPAVDAAIRLGAAIGLAAAARHPAPATLPQPFPEGHGPGQWRPTPPFLMNGLVGDAKPLLFESAADVRGPPPPPLGSPRSVADAEEVRRLGGARSAERTAEQSEAARFWAYQSSQRNFVHLAVNLLQERPLAGGNWAEARLMSQLAAALADSFVLAWNEKRHWAWWRPVTALNLGSEGVPADPAWRPLFGTPPHPDYPSGHATDCATGAQVLEGVFGPPGGTAAYTAIDLRTPVTRRFPTFAAISVECAESRIWAGAHFRAANEEGRRLGAAIARRALASVPALAR